jgi:hypothetical protein
MGLFKGIGKVIKGAVKVGGKVAQVAGAVTGNPALSAAGRAATMLTSGGGKGYTTTSASSGGLFPNGILPKASSTFTGSKSRTKAATTTITPAPTTTTTGTTPTDKQLRSVVKAREQNRDIPVGEVIPGLDKNWWTYRDPVTGVIMKTKDKAAAEYTLAQSLAKVPATTTAADDSNFTPYGVNTGFGTADVDVDVGASDYALSPGLTKFKEQFYGGATAVMPTAEDIAFGRQTQDYARGLFTEASKMDRGQMAKDYFGKQLNLLAPGRAQSASELADQMYSTGRMGFGVGMGTGGYVNPQQYAQQMAIEQQNAQLGLDAEDRAVDIQDRTFQRSDALFKLGNNFQTGGFNTANALFGYGANIEGLGIENTKLAMDWKAKAAELKLRSLGLSSDINTANNKVALAKDTANAQLWNTGIDAASKINWGGIFNSGGSYDALPDTSGDYWSAS